MSEHLSGNQGRPRSQHTHDAVISTTKKLLETLPYPAISVDKIVAESGVSKRTIYRWWNNKAAIILEAISVDDIPEPNTGRLEQDLTLLLTGIFERVATDPKATAIRGLLADAQFDKEFATEFRAYIAKRRQICLNILKRATERKEIKKTTNLELIADLVYGPYWYRLLVGHAELSATFAKELVKTILSGVK